MKVLIFVWNCLALVFCIVAFMLCIVAPECLLILVILAIIGSLKNYREIDFKKRKHKVYIMHDARGRKFRVVV